MDFSYNSYKNLYINFPYVLSRNSRTKYFLLFFYLFLARVTSVYATNDHVKNYKSPNYPFIFDSYGGSYTSASCLISTRSLFNKLDDKLINKKWEENFWVRWPNLVVNNLFNDLLMLWQHEVNGHGFRRRSFNKQIRGYGLSTLLGGIVPSALTSILTPINGLGGVTYPKRSLSEKRPSIDEALLWTIGGNEANAVLASEIILKNFQQGKLDYRDYNLFCKAFTNLLGYLIVTDSSRDGDDIMGYLKDLNYKYSSGNLSLTDLRLGAIVFFLNPMLYNAIWSFYAYAFKNEREVSIPCLSWNQITYMPLIRMGLTPFGMSYYLDNYMGYQDKTLLVSLQAGKVPSQSRYYGAIGCRTNELYNYKRYGLDITTSLWYQPELLLKETDIIKDGNRWGGMLGVHNKLKVNEYLSLHGAFLYKSPGFIEGIVAQGGFIWQAGFSFALPLKVNSQKDVA